MIIKDTLLRDIGRLLVWFPFRWFIASSPYFIVRRFAVIMGFIDHIFSRSRRNQLINNIQIVFGNNRVAVSKIAKGVMITHYLNLLEFFKFPVINLNNIYDHISFEGKQILDQIVMEGKGAILATLHFGTMQYPLVALGHLGYKVNQLGDRDVNASEFSFIHRKVALKYRIRIEDSFKVNHIHISKSIKPIYQCLENGELLMINVDGVGGLKGQKLKKDYIIVNFLGNQVYMPTGAARVARKMGVPIIPINCLRQLDGKHKIIFDPPIYVQKSEDRAVDVQKCIQQIIFQLEKYIRKHPEQWLLWMEFQKGYIIV